MEVDWTIGVGDILSAAVIATSVIGLCWTFLSRINLFVEQNKHQHEKLSHLVEDNSRRIQLLEEQSKEWLAELIRWRR